MTLIPHLPEESLRSSAIVRGKVDIDVVILCVDGFLHEGFVEGYAVDLE